MWLLRILPLKSGGFRLHAEYARNRLLQFALGVR